MTPAHKNMQPALPSPLRGGVGGGGRRVSALKTLIPGNSGKTGFTTNSNGPFGPTPTLPLGIPPLKGEGAQAARPLNAPALETAA